jgi:hypothetical protein
MNQQRRVNFRANIIILVLGQVICSYIPNPDNSFGQSALFRPMLGVLVSFFLTSLVALLNDEWPAFRWFLEQM